MRFSFSPSRETCWLSFGIESKTKPNAASQRVTTHASSLLVAVPSIAARIGKGRLKVVRCIADLSTYILYSHKSLYQMVSVLRSSFSIVYSIAGLYQHDGDLSVQALCGIRQRHQILAGKHPTKSMIDARL